VAQRLYKLKSIANKAPTIRKKDVKKTQLTEKLKERKDRLYYLYFQKGYITRNYLKTEPAKK
jgi:hypothetical protein